MASSGQQLPPHRPSGLRLWFRTRSGAIIKETIALARASASTRIAIAKQPPGPHCRHIQACPSAARLAFCC